jgi:FlaA1/EpsC-like NDP-sugar epimerase
MIKLAGFQPDIDIKIKIVGLRPGEKLYEELLNDTSKPPNLPITKKIMIAEEIIEEYVNLHYDIDKLLLSAV